MAFVVKINLGTDFRRKRFGDASEVTLEAITEMVRESFGFASFLATFRDDEGNPCSLSARTLPDALGLSSGTLRLTIQEVTQGEASLPAQPRPTIMASPATATHRRRPHSIAASGRPLLVPGRRLLERPQRGPSVGATPLAARKQGGNLAIAKGPVPRPSERARAEDGHDAALARALELSADELRGRAEAESRADEELARAVAESSREEARRRAKAEREADGDLARAVAESERLGRRSSAAYFTALRPAREQLLHRMYERDADQKGLAHEKCRRLLDSLGLKVIEAGSINYSERGQLMTNQCFYLALARSFLGPSELVKDVALAFKRIIEQRVLKEHPEWHRMGQVGECEQAYADFLVSPMKDTSTDFAEFAVLLVDSTTGCVEIFRGVGFDAAVKRDRTKATKNLLLLWYIPGHYQALGAGDAQGSKPLLTLASIIDVLDREGIEYVESCG